MSRGSVRDMWDVQELSQSTKHLYPLRESGHGRMVIAYAFTLLSSYFLPFSSSCVTLFKFRLPFPFGVYLSVSFHFFHFSFFLFMRRMESVLDFSILFSSSFLNRSYWCHDSFGFLFLPILKLGSL